MKRRSLRNTENHVSKDDGKATNCRVNQSQKEFKVGDITWARLHNCTWWPAQVVDEECVSAIAKPKKKVDGEALVRLYGTYEYLYVDTVTGGSEFEKENVSVKEAFQKALEEDISHVKSGRLLKRELSTFEENATVKASNNKKRKEDRITRNWEGDCVNSESEAGFSLGKSDKGPTQTKEPKKNRSDDSEDKKQKGDMRRNQEVAIKTKDGASNDKKLKQIEVRRPPGTEQTQDRRPILTREAKRKIEYSSMNKKSKEDFGGNQQVAVEAKGGASRGKKLKQEEAIKPMETEKNENMGRQTRKAVTNRENAYQNQKAKEDLGGNQNVPITPRHDASIDKKLQKDEIGKTMKDRVDASNGVYTRKEKVTDKDKNEIKVKKLKCGSEAFETRKQQQNGIGKSEKETVSKHLKAYSPGSAKCDAKEKPADYSARRMKMMQSLGLIAPSGSPYVRNGSTKAVFLKV